MPSLNKIEKPILFSGPMVRATQKGTKNQTRRLNGLDEINQVPDIWTLREIGILDAYTKKSAKGRFGAYFETTQLEPRTLNIYPIPCPWQVGDLLWVRETWCKLWELDDDDQIIEGTKKYYYRAGEQPTFDRFLKDNGTYSDNIPWKPSIYMPRAAARIFLRVKDIWIERLEDITAKNALAEGCKVCPGGFVFPGTAYDKIGLCHSSPEMAFQVMWGEIYPDSPINPWLWALEFERLG